MKTKYIMASSAIVLALTGLACTFLPDEISKQMGGQSSGVLQLQIIGAAYVGFAMLNWSSKGNIIGGIYSRPLVIGNLSHFFIGALAIIKYASNIQNAGYIWVAAFAYSLFAACFAWLFFTSPPSSK
ncbi:MAG: hypothetical protein JWQ27_2265 [Ferruginibacter sp.]|nr:hypothetical protein [Ferruginibacter sp.]